MQRLNRWEAKYITDLKDKDLLAWDDFYAWQRYPKFSWVYDKQALAKFTNLPTYDLEREIPDNSFYPYIVKPNSEDEIEDWSGMIAQEFMVGQQGTADIVILEGTIKDSFAFTTHTNFYGEITLFESNPFLPLPVANLVRNLFQDYTGVINVEYIEGTVFEIHLRPSLQFYDICGGFIEQLPSFMKTKKWEKTKYERTFSRVFRTKHDGIPEIKSLPPIGEAIRSIQLCWEDGKKLSETDPSLGKNRYMVINGTNLQAIENYAKGINLCLKP